MSSAVISSGNPPPVIEATEHALDAISLFVRPLVVSGGLLAAGTAGNARFDPEIDQGTPEPIIAIYLMTRR